MTDKEAIDNLKNYIECLMEDYGYYKDIVEFRDSVEHLEKSLKTQQAEIEKLRNNNKDLLRKLLNRVKEVKKLTRYSLYKKEFSTLNKKLKQKDKIIDEMATYIATLDIEEDICEKTKNEHCDKMNFGECEDCIKQYFERKSENGN